MPGFHFFRTFRGGHGDEVMNLDRPVSNFDVAGVPTGAWSSSLFGCLGNLRPSCIMSFCLPCVLWSQVIICFFVVFVRPLTVRDGDCRWWYAPRSRVLS